MEPKVKVHYFFFEDHNNIHRSNLESDPTIHLVSSEDTLKLLPLISHDSMFLDSLLSPTSTHNDLQPMVSRENIE